MGEHRVSLLSTRLRRNGDPETSRDPAVRALVGGLREIGSDPVVFPPMRVEFRDELRAQLVAITPRIVAEANPEATGAPRPRPHRVPEARPAERERAAGPRSGADAGGGARAIPIARPLGVLAAVIAMFALLLGGLVLLSRNALPGDALYGVKRAGERVQLAFASSSQEKAGDYLDFAADRVNEARKLTGRTQAQAAGGTLADGSIDSHTANLITSSLVSSNSDLRSAAQLLNGEAVRAGSGQPLDKIRMWAPDQLDRLTRLWTAMPANEPALRAQAASARALVTDTVTRAKSLQKQVRCRCTTTKGSSATAPAPAPGGARTSGPGRGGATTGGPAGGAKHSSAATPHRSRAPAPHRSRTSVPQRGKPGAADPAPQPGKSSKSSKSGKSGKKAGIVPGKPLISINSTCISVIGLGNCS